MTVVLWPPASAADGTTLDVLEHSAGQIRLPLDDAIALALEHNLTLGIERRRHAGALLGIQQSLGVYDLQIDADLAASSDTSPTSSTLEAADLLVSDRQQANLGLSQLTPSGSTVRLDLNNSRFESSNLNTDPNPAYAISLDLTVNQPLLRDFGRAATNRDLIVARRDAEISVFDLQDQVEDIVQQVSDGYWELVEARQQLKVAEESLQFARQLSDLTRRQVEAGIKAPLETVQSDAGVAAQRENLIQLRTQVADAADVLRQLIDLEAGAWDLELEPVTEPEVTAREVDLEEALADAYAERPDMRRQRLRNETLALNARLARQDVLPQLDLSAGYGLNGIEGDSFLRDDNGVVIEDDAGRPIILPAGYSAALQQILDQRFDGWRLALNFSYPLQNRAARARSLEAGLQLEQGELELERLRLQVRADVRRAARALDAAAERIEAARIASQLAAKSLEVEQLRYDHGQATSFDVLQVQRDLIDARQSEVTAIVNYRRTVTRFDRAIGRLLESHDVVLETAGD